MHGDPRIAEDAHAWNVMYGAPGIYQGGLTPVSIRDLLCVLIQSDSHSKLGRHEDNPCGQHCFAGKRRVGADAERSSYGTRAAKGTALTCSVCAQRPAKKVHTHTQSHTRVCTQISVERKRQERLISDPCQTLNPKCAKIRALELKSEEAKRKQKRKDAAGSSLYASGLDDSSIPEVSGSV